jgi:hypothetical protein
MLSFSRLRFCNFSATFELRLFSLFYVMASDISQVLAEVVGAEVEVPRPEVSAKDSSSGDDTGNQFEGESVEGGKGIGAIDPRKSTQSYDFRPSIVTISHIRQLEALGYFEKGSAHEPGEEVISETPDDEDVVFEGFFCCRSPVAATASLGQHSS